MSFLNKLEKLMSDKGIENISRLSRETGIPYTTIDGFYKKGTEMTKRDLFLSLFFNLKISKSLPK